MYRRQALERSGVQPAACSPGRAARYHECGEGVMEMTGLMHTLLSYARYHDFDEGVMEVTGRMPTVLFYARYHVCGSCAMLLLSLIPF